MNIAISLPIISAFFVLFLGFFVFFKDVKSRINLVFLLFSLVNFVWFFGTFMMFLGKSVFFWDKFVYVGVIFIPSIVYHFTVLLIDKRKEKKLFVNLGYILSFIFLNLLLFTDLFVSGSFQYEWGAHLKAGIFHHLYLIFFISYIIMMFWELIIYHNAVDSRIEKNKIRYVVLAMFFLTVGSVGFLPAYQVSIYPVAYLSGLFFSVTTGYAITKYQLLRIKTFAAQFLIVAINLIALSYIFVSDGVDEYIMKTVFFIGIFFTSFLLKQSFDNEFKQKEKLEELTKKLAQNNKKLKALDKAKNEFISITAHQLRTPPTVIKGYITLAQDDPRNKLTKEAEESLERALISNERLIDLVEDILNVSRIESGNMRYESKDIDVHEDILKELYDAFILKAKQKGLSLTLHKSPSPLPKLNIDGKKLREVISNLIDNAIKYTRKGGVEVFSKKHDGNIRIEVKDTGVGVPKDEMPYLFKKFSRGKKPSRLGAEGTGLGIFVGKKIVEDYGGKIWIESEGANKGSTFIVEIPISQVTGSKGSSSNRGGDKSKMGKKEEIDSLVSSIFN